ncbi:right-handed parallel beta-helix repeat-containing protein [Salipiger pacificus]|nr:right-handed parallel beta-helix repeat-containing protein [Alloyangia pacifica]MCA0947191.1 right-handed parallel beta-helix repeat-containing protein [Alloyangia pacifica]
MVAGRHDGVPIPAGPTRGSTQPRPHSSAPRRRLVCLALAMLLGSVSLAAQPVWAQTSSSETEPPGATDSQTVLRVAGPQELRAALARARGGEVIALAPGDYGTLGLRGAAAAFDRPLTLRSADPDDRARFERIALRGARNLVLEQLDFHHQPEAGESKLLAMLEVRGSGDDPARGITVRGCRFAGAPVADGVGADPRDAVAVARQQGLVTGNYAGMGIRMQNAEDVAVTGNEVTGVYRGFSLERVAGLEVSGNLVHDVRSDGMTFGQLEHARIERNIVRDLHPWRHAEAEHRGDHPDLMQFWTTNSDAPTRDVVIRGNLLVQRAVGENDRAQGIFMRNSKAEADDASEEFFFRDLVIEDNVILSAHINALVVGESIGLSVSGNLLLQEPGAGPDKVATPILSIARRSSGVRVGDNLLPDLSRNYATVQGYASLTEGAALGWEVRGNRFTRRDREAGTVLSEEGAMLYRYDRTLAEIEAAMGQRPADGTSAPGREIALPKTPCTPEEAREGVARCL